MRSLPIALKPKNKQFNQDEEGFTKPTSTQTQVIKALLVQIKQLGLCWNNQRLT